MDRKKRIVKAYEMALKNKLSGIGIESQYSGVPRFLPGICYPKQDAALFRYRSIFPSGQVSDKVSAVFQFVDELLFHVTRSIRWNSDHVIILNDEVRAKRLSREPLNGMGMG